MGDVFCPSDYPYGPRLDFLQQVSVLPMLGIAEMDV